MHLVEPDLKLGGFSLWVFGHQFPGATDYWDGNWLNVRARVEAPGAVVETKGPIVQASELAGFEKELETLHGTLAGEGALRCMEPDLATAIRCGSLGHVAVRIMITPDHMTQSHELENSATTSWRADRAGGELRTYQLLDEQIPHAHHAQIARRANLSHAPSLAPSGKSQPCSRASRLDRRGVTADRHET